VKLKRYFRRSILSLWAISLLVLTGLAVVIIQREKAAEVKRELNELQELALALTAEIRSFPQLEDRGLTELLLTQARLSGIRITLIEGSGRVAFDSEKKQLPWRATVIGQRFIKPFLVRLALALVTAIP